jgi:DNA-binding NtrC family response regulator
MASILIVDDVPENLQVLFGILEPLGHEVRISSGGVEALKLAREYVPDLILLDVNMPDINGFDVCRKLRQVKTTEDVPVIFLTARIEPEDVVEGFAAGGADYLVKPFNEDELKARVDTQLKLRSLVKELTDKNEALESEIAQRKALATERDNLADRITLMTEEESRRWGLDGFVGQSKTLRTILEEVRKLQQAGSTSVLITGESGTGKELVARAIHFGSDRASQPFVPVNCSAVPHELADSLFFGHVKGAFTGADRDKQGYFEMAEGGTLFLDELGDMPLDLQAKLLRVLESRKVMRVGTATERNINVRILSATNADLESAVKEGRFRQDLYFRLAGYPVHVPPLRERKDDIPILTEHFLETLGEEIRVSSDITLSDAALQALQSYPFPGNIRELKSVIERALVASGGNIEPEHLHLTAPVGTPGASKTAINYEDLPLNIEKAELALIHRAIGQTAGNMSEAARLLGINRVTLYRKLAKAGEPIE